MKPRKKRARIVERGKHATKVMCPRCLKIVVTDLEFGYCDKCQQVLEVGEED